MTWKYTNMSADYPNYKLASRKARRSIVAWMIYAATVFALVCIVLVLISSIIKRHSKNNTKLLASEDKFHSTDMLFELKGSKQQTKHRLYFNSNILARIKRTVVQTSRSLDLNNVDDTWAKPLDSETRYDYFNNDDLVEQKEGILRSNWGKNQTYDELNELGLLGNGTSFQRTEKYCKVKIKPDIPQNKSHLRKAEHGELAESEAEHDECKREKDSGLPAVWTMLYIFIVLFLFVALAIICDEFFVPSLEVISERLNLSEDVAGATFMAAGSSAPELFTSIAGVGSGSDVGVGTIVGSAVFNLLVIIALTSALAGKVLTIDWRPLIRDSIFYGFSVLVFILFSWDATFQWWESFLLLLLYVAYIVTMKYNYKLMEFMKSWACCSCLEISSGRVSPSLENGPDVENLPNTNTTKPQTTDVTAAATEKEKSDVPEIKDISSPSKSILKSTKANGGTTISKAEIACDTKCRCCCCCCCCCRNCKANQKSNGNVSIFPNKTPSPSGSIVPVEEEILCEECAQTQSCQHEYQEIANTECYLESGFPIGERRQDSSDVKENKCPSWSRGGSTSSSITPPPPYSPVKENAQKRYPRFCNSISLDSMYDGTDRLTGKRKFSKSSRKNSSKSLGFEKDTRVISLNSGSSVEEVTRYTEQPALEIDLCAEGPGNSDSGPSTSGNSGGGEGGNEEEEEENTLLVFPCLPPIRHAPPPKPDSSHCVPSAKYLGALSVYVMSFPWICAFTWSIPDCSKPENKKWYIMSFVMSILWIAGISYVMVEVVEIIGCLMGIDTYTMGLVVIAIGTSVPDAISSVLVARAGFGDMAVSNAIGSNVFDINLGLGLPFLISSMITAQPVELLSPLQSCLLENLPLTIRMVPHVKFGLILLLILFLCLLMFLFVRFRLNRAVGIIFVVMYLCFMIYAFVQEKVCYGLYC